MSKVEFIDFQVIVSRTDGSRYLASVLSRAEVEAAPAPAVATLDVDLGALDDAVAAPDPSLAYGVALYETLFGDPGLSGALSGARMRARQGGIPLRFRLYITGTASPLQTLRWERMVDPATKRPMFAGEEILFSRYLCESLWRPLQLRQRSDLRALVVVANPTDIALWRMSPINVEEELARARGALGSIPCDVVQGPSTLRRMMEALRGGLDVLYLVCHGGIDPKTRESCLWFEQEDGTSARVVGAEVVAQLVELVSPPRLVVLSSCFTAGAGDEARANDPVEVFGAVGPKLAEAGLPAVLAMQGDITMKTAAVYMRTFFTELGRDGLVDRAASLARGAALNDRRHDYWMPVLYSRLNDGRIWTREQLAASADERFKGWDGVLEAIENQRCTPVLGPALLEAVIGPTEELLRRWAADQSIDRGAFERDGLPRFSQYLSVKIGVDNTRAGLLRRVRAEVRRRWMPDAPKPTAPLLKNVDAVTGDLLETARESLRRLKGVDPYDELGRLPFSLYVTTSADDQLERALRSGGREPIEELCRWHEPESDDDDDNRPYWPASVFDRARDFKPDERSPMVYHLFGRWDRPHSTVLTEDDYFDFLISVNQAETTRIPIGVSGPLKKHALLFLGFSIDSWEFRALFRALDAQGGKRGLNTKYNHVAVQLQPDERSSANPGAVREYLEKYFTKRSSIEIYWGRTEDFVRDLAQKYEERRQRDGGTE